MKKLRDLVRGETWNRQLNVFVNVRTWEHMESLKAAEILNRRQEIPQLVRASILMMPSTCSRLIRAISLGRKTSEWNAAAENCAATEAASLQQTREGTLGGHRSRTCVFGQDPGL